MGRKSKAKIAQSYRRRMEQIERDREALREDLMPEEVDFKDSSSPSDSSIDDDFTDSDGFIPTDDDKDDDKVFDKITIPVDDYTIYWKAMRNSQKLYNKLKQVEDSNKKAGSFISKDGFKLELW